MAIFLGQIAAALISGNTVFAKPAEQTSLVAWRVITLAIQAGIDQSVLQLVPGDGAFIGQRVLLDERIAGVAFTGSTETAHRINQQLSSRAGSILPFIAETGGQNAMIVDSTALPEQVIMDVINRPFLVRVNDVLHYVCSTFKKRLRIESYRC